MRDREPQLTRREREVLVELCRPALGSGAFAEPASVRDIARALDVTEAAIKQHLLRLYDKFGIHDRSTRRRVRLANQAMERGVVGVADVTVTDGSDAKAGDLLANGRKAMVRRQWRSAYLLLSEADDSGQVQEADDLAALGEAAAWSGEMEISGAARLRAYNAYVDAEDHKNAGMLALALVVNHVVRLRYSVAGGWCRKARRHLEQVPQGIEHGHLAAVESMLRLGEGKLDDGLERATAAFDIGQRHGSRDLKSLGMVFQATALTQLGRHDEAMPLFDEAMASAATGQLHPLAAGVIYCRTLCSCIDRCDYQRALEWTEEIDRARRDDLGGGFPGDCRVHRAQVLAAHGEWSEAEQEARIACSEARTFDLAHAGLAEAELGLLALRRGQLEEAARAFQRANELGVTAEPGVSLLSLVRGQPAAAAASISSALDQVRSMPLKRAVLLPAQIEIALVGNDRETARAAAGELEAIAHEHGGLALEAAANCGRGVVLQAEGDLHAACEHLRSGIHQWLQLGNPYEAARARVALAEVLAGLGDASGCTAELRSAQKSFSVLGAIVDDERVHRLLEQT